MRKMFRHRSHLDVSAEALCRFHLLPDALEVLQPPWEKVKVVSRSGAVDQPGSRITLCVSIGPFAQTWVAEHSAYEPGRMFRDTMVSGPFPFWEHTHLFEPDGPNASWLEDRVEYELPLGWFGHAAAGWYVNRRLRRLFEYRHRVTIETLGKPKTT